MIKKIGFFILFILTSPSFAEDLKPLSRTINEKAFLVGLKSTVFNTTSVYNDFGTPYKLSQSELFQKYDYDLFLKYGFSRDLEIFGDFNMRSIMAKTSSAENNISGLESFSLGLKYQMRPIGSLTFAWEAYYRKTIYSKSSTSVLTLGDPGLEVAVHFLGSYSAFNRQFFSFLLGYKRPANELSSEIPYLLESVWTRKKWSLFVGLEGNLSMNQDLYSSNPENKPGIEVASNSPSELYNSINKKVMNGYGKIRKNFGRWNLEVGYRQVLSGFSTDAGWQAELSLSWQTDGISRAKRKKERFKEYEIDALITKVSPRGGFAKIDKGRQDYIEKGMEMDIYYSDFKGKNVLVGKGIIYETKANWSILKIIKKYVDRPIKEGFIVRGRL